MKHGTGHVYTFISLLISVTFIFGSMAAMNVILRIEEGRLLSESGKTIMESPVRAWEDAGNHSGETAGEKPDKFIYTLTNGQMEEAIGSWNSRRGETVHNPVAGQISMEEAIQEGKMWLAAMGIEGNGQEADADSVNAVLSTPERKDLLPQKGSSEKLEPYYSFWTVRFSGGSVSAVLYVNAVTGKVLGAEIAFYKKLPDKLPVEKLSLFAELAGLQAGDAETVFDLDGTLAFLELAGSQMRAEMEFRHGQKGYFDLAPYGQDSTEAGADLYYNEYVVITYKLTVMDG